MAGIPTSNILQPGAISIPSQNRQLMVDLQLLTPQYYKKYTEKYGNEDFTWWLAAHAGMEEVKNQNFFWFENRGKLMPGVTTVGNVVAANGATITLTLAAADHYNSGTQSPLREGETVRVASTNVEGQILADSRTCVLGNGQCMILIFEAARGYRAASLEIAGIMPGYSLTILMVLTLAP